MDAAAQKDIENLVCRVFDDLVDECTLKEKSLKNGMRLAAKSLIREAILLKEECLEELKQIEAGATNESRDSRFRGLSSSVRRKSLSIVDRMSELGL